MPHNAAVIRQYADQFYARYRSVFQQAWTNLYYGPDIPGIKLQRALAYFPGLLPDNELPLLLYDNRRILGTAYVGFVITDQNFYYALRTQYLGNVHVGVLPLGELQAVEFERHLEGLSNYNVYANHSHLGNLILYMEEATALNHFFNGLFVSRLGADPLAAATQPDLQALVNQDLRVYAELLDTKQGLWSFFDLVAHEADALIGTLRPLIQSAWEDELLAAVLHDLRVILHICGYADRNLEPRETFPMIYLAGKLAEDQENMALFDSLRTQSLANAQAVLLSLADSFYQWIHEVSHEDELELPYLLTKLDRRHRTHSYAATVQALYRFATLYVKADGVIRPEEETALQQVWDLLTEPMQ